MLFWGSLLDHYWLTFPFHKVKKTSLTLYAPILQNGQTHLNISSEMLHFILPTNCLSVFDHFVGLVLKGLKDVLHNLHQLFTEGMWIMFSSLSNHRNLPTRFENI